MLRQREIKVEDVAPFVGLTSTVSLEPDPIPLDIKVIVFGDRLLYYLLSAYDPEIGADFEDDIDRTAESEATDVRLIASLLAQEQLKPLDRDGASLVLEHAARLADDSGSADMRPDSADQDGTYPGDSINGLIEVRLRTFARALEQARKALFHDQGET